MAKKPRKILILLGIVLLIGGGFWVIKHQNRDVIKQTVEQKQIYYCPMHPNYTSPKPGECPICGMTLVLKKEGVGQRAKGVETGEVFVSTEKQQTIGVKTDTVRVINLQKSIRAKGIVEYDERRIYHIHTKIDGFIEKLYVNYTGKLVKDLGNRLCVAETAVIDTGPRQVVILAKGEGYFKPQEVKLGAKSENYYEVLQGKKGKGEKINKFPLFPNFPFSLTYTFSYSILSYPTA